MNYEFLLLVFSKTLLNTLQEIVRPKKIFTPLVIPETLKKNLPFKNTKKDVQRKDPIERIAVVREPHEKKVRVLFDLVVLTHCHAVPTLTHYQTTNFRMFQTERVCQRQFQI